MITGSAAAHSSLRGYALERGTPDYERFISGASSFNTSRLQSRRAHLPYLDPASGVAQKPCRLYRSTKERLAPDQPYLVWRYPAARWLKKRKRVGENGANDLAASGPDSAVAMQQLMRQHPGHPLVSLNRLPVSAYDPTDSASSPAVLDGDMPSSSATSLHQQQQQQFMSNSAGNAGGDDDFSDANSDWDDTFGYSAGREGGGGRGGEGGGKRRYGGRKAAAVAANAVASGGGRRRGGGAAKGSSSRRQTSRSSSVLSMPSLQPELPLAQAASAVESASASAASTPGPGGGGGGGGGAGGNGMGGGGSASSIGPPQIDAADASTAPTSAGAGAAAAAAANIPPATSRAICAAATSILLYEKKAPTHRQPPGWFISCHGNLRRLRPLCPSRLPAVHRGHGLGQHQLSVAVHRVQNLLDVRHL
ncbi:hypothetical protein BOX15_Mlig029435g2 [Macrostomum lignano]|uniref:DPF1-3 N-terminal domain-containing protein n=1 Tax=Macrostomum lignano TaxID=282301 RepID=A0A267GI17_9PLAT|nr:hypothetical protein BOX15_Mlig029435g2 [Macrostomum lignano]